MKACPVGAITKEQEAAPSSIAQVFVSPITPNLDAE
jgi:hypothetical protein